MVDDHSLADLPGPFDVASSVLLIEELRCFEAQSVLAEEVGGERQGITIDVIALP